MHITSVRVTAVTAHRQYATLIGAARLDPIAHTLHDLSDFLLIEASTDTGLTGLGEISDIPEGMTLPDGQPVNATAVTTWLQQHVVGLDPYDLTELEQRLTTTHNGQLHKPGRLLLCAIDTLCYDLQGKHAGVPAYQLCGGAVRYEALVSYVAFIREPHLLRDEIAQQTAAGFTAFKLKVGLDPARDLAAMQVAREEAGPNASIKLDANGAWSVDEAIDILRQLERWHPAGIETPIKADNLEGMRRVREATGMPLLEHVSTQRYALAAIQAKAVDVFNVSCVGCGGIFRARHVLDLASAAGVECLLGSTVELGIGTAAQLHLAASSPAVTWPSDLVGPLVYTADVVAEPWQWRHGYLGVPTTPGIGVSLDPARVAHLAG
jgi:muconate cycloisomerase